MEITSVYFINSSLGFCAGKDIVIKTIDGGQTWSEYKITNLTRYMKQVRFKNTQEGYIVCPDNTIIITYDGGLTWKVSNPPATNGYYAVASTSGNIYAAAQSGIIKSTNRGNSWTQLPNSPSAINVMHFVNDNTGYAAGTGNYSGGDFGYSYGSLYSTDNGGLSWNGSADIKTGRIIDISFPPGKTAYVLSVGSYYGSSVIKLNL